MDQIIIRQHSHLTVRELLEKALHSGNPLAELVAKQVINIDERTLENQEDIIEKVERKIEELFIKDLVVEILDKVTSVSVDELMRYFEGDFKRDLLTTVSEALMEALDENLHEGEKVRII